MDELAIIARNWGPIITLAGIVGTVYYHIKRSIERSEKNEKELEKKEKERDLKEEKKHKDICSAMSDITSEIKLTNEVVIALNANHGNLKEKVEIHEKQCREDKKEIHRRIDGKADK